jgi:hypothetical protein
MTAEMKFERTERCVAERIAKQKGYGFVYTYTPATRTPAISKLNLNPPPPVHF